MKALGYSPNDVRHLPLTHLDRDHTGGVPDFPNAEVHVRRREHAMAVTHQIPPPAGRYITDQWKHGPKWKFCGEGGEHWFGFEDVRALDDREGDVLMIPLHGHTLGHCGIAVRSKDNGCCMRAMPTSSTVSCSRSRECRWWPACFSAAPTWTVRTE